MGPKRKAALAAALVVAVVASLLPPGRSRARDEGPRRGDPIIVGEVTRVRDGDTIEVGRVAVRLQGVAAPELRQPLGAEARRYLREITAGERVACEPDGTRSYDRVVAVCRIGGQDIGAALVRRGLARDCARYSRGRYAAAEAAAATAGAGIRERYRLPGYCRRQG